MSHIDATLIEELKLVLEDEFGDLIKAFLDDSAERMTLIRQYFTNEDWHMLSRTAHSFKGSAGNLGATILADLAMQLEDSAREQQATQNQIDQLDQEQLVVCQQLQQYLS